MPVDLKRIRSMRAFKSVNQKVIGEMLSIRGYSAKERGELKFSLEDCLCLALFFQLSSDEFNKIFLQGRLRNGEGNREDRAAM
jgi:hypothetical protein